MAGRGACSAAGNRKVAALLLPPNLGPLATMATKSMVAECRVAIGRPPYLKATATARRRGSAVRPRGVPGLAVVVVAVTVTTLVVEGRRVLVLVNRNSHVGDVARTLPPNILDVVATTEVAVVDEGKGKRKTHYGVRYLHR
jgi:hypothetical protein